MSFWLFPFEYVKKDCKLVLYGAGQVGRCFATQLQKTGFCSLLAVLDQHAGGNLSNGVPILAPEEICSLDFEYVLIATEILSVTTEMRNKLLALGIAKDKILFFPDRSIEYMSQDTPSLLRLEKRVEKIEAELQGVSSFSQLKKRIGMVEEKLRGMGVYEFKSRLDKRLVRLELLDYYSQDENQRSLDDEQKRLVRYLRQKYLQSQERVIKEDMAYSKVVPSNAVLTPELKEENGYWYFNLSGHKLYCGTEASKAVKYIKSVLRDIETVNNPHQYLQPEKDGFDVPEGAVLCDVGAAEGYFGVKYLDRCKKVYFFETERRWIDLLKKTCADFMHKVEIVQGAVGDTEGDILLDDFFKNREKPTFIKMDIEGAEGAALRGMKGLIEDNYPLCLLICTYHRQEDWDHFYAMLHDRFTISHSDSYYWHMLDPMPPFFRRGVMRAKKNVMH
jgi:hypothetical protein